MRKIKSILLIDDDEVNNFINRSLIHKLGMSERTEVATNGLLGLELLKVYCQENDNECPPLIILDHQMPVMDGIDFMKNLNKMRLKKRKSGKILLLAAHASKSDIEVYKELGVDEYSPKPLLATTLTGLWKKYWHREEV